MTELQKTFMAYPKEEQMYMLELDKMSKVDLILWLNNLNNIRKKELEKQNLELTEKELNLLTDALYKRWGYETLEEKPESLASKLMEKLYDTKDELKK